MIIDITDEFRIKTDPYNFQLQQYREVKPKDKPTYYVWKRIGFYPGLQSALSALPDHVALTEDLEGLSALTERLTAIAEEAAVRLLK